MRIIIKVLKILFITIFTIIVAIGILEVVADLFFNNASSIDTCLDAGGKWDYKDSKCLK